LFIFVIVIGSIYAGLATPTESAALGVLVALALAAWRGRLGWRMLIEALEGTVRITSAIMLIILGAYFLNVVMSAIGLTAAITDLVTALDPTPMQLLASIILFYLILGCFMETLSMMVATVPNDALDRRRRLRPDLVRRAGGDPDGDRDGDAADWHQPVRGPGRAPAWTDSRRDHRRSSLRGHAAGDGGADLRLASACALAPGSDALKAG
jgi:Tripartite ATP-independent periplasmic transporter, DctM component